MIISRNFISSPTFLYLMFRRRWSCRWPVWGTSISVGRRPVWKCLSGHLPSKIILSIFFSYFWLSNSLSLDSPYCTLFTVIGCLGRHLLGKCLKVSRLQSLDAIDFAKESSGAFTCSNQRQTRDLLTKAHKKFKQTLSPQIQNCISVCKANHIALILKSATLSVFINRNQERNQLHDNCFCFKYKDEEHSQANGQSICARALYDYQAGMYIYTSTYTHAYSHTHTHTGLLTILSFQQRMTPRLHSTLARSSPE